MIQPCVLMVADDIEKIRDDGQSGPSFDTVLTSLI
jgi:hypothetical protein